MSDTIARARGRWREILPLLGVETRFLSPKHGPCVLCGGVDRYRFDDRHGEGDYFCSQCGPGNGITMLRKLRGWDFKTAAAEVDKILGTVAQVAPELKQPADDPERKRRAIDSVIAGATDRSIGDRYLFGRGLAVTSPVLRGHPKLWHSEARNSFPAVIAPIIGPDGELQSVQRIFLGDGVPSDARKTIMPPIKTISGGAVRLFDAAPEMGIAEGIETALAASQLWGLPTWAALTAGNLEAWQAPAEAKMIHVFGDNDVSYTGQAVAYQLARRLVREKRKVQVHIPDQVDADWLDVLCQQGAAA